MPNFSNLNRRQALRIMSAAEPIRHVGSEQPDKHTCDGVIRDAAKAMADSGMIRYGCAYVNIDDCWMVRPAAGYPVPADTALYRNPEEAAKLLKQYNPASGAVDPAHGEPRDAEGKINANPRFPDMKGLTGAQRVRDLWRQQELGEFSNQFQAKVPRHGVVLVRMEKKSWQNPDKV